MGITKIEWADCVWNPVTGCSPVSEGAKTAMLGYPEDGFKVTLHQEKLLEPLKWKRPRRVFVCSMGDLFHENIPYDFLEHVFFTMEEADHHTFMILTKRPRRALGFLKWLANRWSDWDVGEVWTPPSNIWIGVTAENQARADERIPILLEIPTAVRFVSCEPLLGYVDLSPWLELCRGCGATAVQCGPTLWREGRKCCPECTHEGARLDWVIVGGETGPNARPMHPDWVRNLRDQCKAAGVPFFFKQWGEYQLVRLAEPLDVRNKKTGDFETWPAGKEVFKRVGRKVAGRLLDGRRWEEMPSQVMARDQIESFKRGMSTRIRLLRGLLDGNKTKPAQENIFKY